MKNLGILILLLFIIGCKPKEEAKPKKEIKPLDEQGLLNVTMSFKPAVDFVNAYINNAKKMKEAEGIVAWTKNSPLATDNFKTILEKFVSDAENGLDFDPILDAQDFPEEGVVLHRFDPRTGYVVVKGKKQQSFQVAVKLVWKGEDVMVDGCGIVNIPEEKRAKR